jgi:hypothetical protein
MLVLYTFIGAVTYYFIGEGVRSPALLSNSPLVSKISFGLALRKSACCRDSRTQLTSLPLNSCHLHQWSDQQCVAQS